MSIGEMIDALIEREGGFVNDPDDRGGATKYGITLATLRDVGENPNASVADVEALTKGAAELIYEEVYFVHPGFDLVLDARLAEQLFDWGVNSGPATAIKAIQRLVDVTADGVLGPVTAKAINACGTRHLARKLVGERILFYARLVRDVPSQAKFIYGWQKRALEFLD